jgi:hypothetical protein
MPNAKQLFTICAAVFALGALTATPATATTPGWSVGGERLTGSEPLATTAAIDEDGRLKFGGTEVICSGKNLNATAPVIEASNKGSATSLLFTGCEVTLHGCRLSGQNSGGEIGTLPVTTELTLEGALAAVATLKPNTGLFATIAFTGAGCTITGVQPFRGTAQVSFPTAQDESTLQLMNYIATAASGELKWGSNPASLEGSALLKLAGGRPWSFETEPKNPGWMVKGAPLTGSKALATTAPLDGQTKLESDATTIVCSGKNLNAVAPEIISPNKGAAKELEFTECEGEGKCTIASTKIGTEPLSIEATLAGASAVVETLKPVTSNLIAVIKYVGKECSLSGTKNLNGTIKLEAPTGHDEQTLQQFNSLASEASGELEIEGHKAALEASALFKLASGEPWSLL